LNWKGSDAFPVIAVYSTPTLNWKLEASRIASAWLEGPPASSMVQQPHEGSHDLQPLTAIAS
jgi:hypothetical protein